MTLALLLRSLVWYLTYASPLTADFATGGHSVQGLDGYAGIAWTNLAGHIAGATGILLEGALVSLVVVTAARHLRLPTGALGTMLVLYAFLIAASTDQWLALLAVAGAAIVAEMLWARIRRGWLGGREAATGYFVLGGAVPLVQSALYLALLGAFDGGLVWTPHLWVGVPIAAGVYGIAVTALTMPRALFGTDERLRAL